MGRKNEIKNEISGERENEKGGKRMNGTLAGERWRELAKRAGLRFIVSFFFSRW